MTMVFYYVALGYYLIGYCMINTKNYKFFQVMALPFLVASLVIPCFGIAAFMADDKFSLMVLSDPELFDGFRTICMWLLWLRMISLIWGGCVMGCLSVVLCVKGREIL